MSELARFARAAQEGEDDLIVLCTVFERLIARAINTLQTTDADLRLWLKSPKNKSPKQSPFTLPQDPETLNRYVGIWKRFICYIFRTALTSASETPTAIGVMYNQEQLEMIFAVRRQILRVGSANKESREMEKLLSRLFALLCSCIQHRLAANQPFTSPIMHWLAVEGIHVEADRLRRPQEYTRILAASLYIHRLLILEAALPKTEWHGLPVVTQAACQNPLERLQNYRRIWLTEGSASPTSKILRTLAYRLSIIKREGTAPVVHWSDDGEVLFYTGRAITMSSLRQCLRSMISEAEQTLLQLTWGDATSISLLQIQDSLTWNGLFNKTGYSFVTATANQLDIGFTYSLSRAAEANGSQKLVKATATGLEWHEQRCTLYLQQERHVCNQLFSFMHMLGGQPARGPEIGCIQICNNVYTQRNIYVLAGEVVFVTAYDKNLARGGTVEYIFRYLPGVLGQLLVRYLVYMRPFACALPIDCCKDDYLFATPNGPFNGGHASEALQTAAQKHLGYGPDEYTRWKGPGYDNNSGTESEDEENIWDRQAGHGTRIAQLHYAVQSGFLQRIQQPQLNAFCAASKAWHDLLLRPDNTIGALVDSASAHRRIASSTIESPWQKRPRQQTSSGSGFVRERTTSRLPGTEPGDDMQYQLQTILTHLHGVNAKFRSQEQQDAMEFVLSTPRQSIVVLPTGGGKSMLFMGRAVIANDRVVIVIVPYVAPIDDLLARAHKHNVPAMRCTFTTTEVAALIVVSADIAINLGFSHYATQLASDGRLQQVFLDECHVAITDITFRQRLRSQGRDSG
ncbi:MAG: hypothetical protein M1816_003627 [Peltula sp. TS41687]|nr:MAG: hypothetical protein M1816_003627 [Peltula sp. TS41687]